jgi:CubicO group peptidase (beta-lactamase class C family)
LEPGTSEAIEWIKRWIFREPLIAEPDQRETYSDLGFMILGWWLEACHGKGLDTLFQENVATPLGLENTAFIPISTWESIGARFDSPEIATTEVCPGRRRLIHGEVHDENAFFLGGVAGHAGLFSTAEDVGKWADTLLACSKKDGFLSTSVIQRFWHPTFPQEHGTWRFSWDGPSPEGSSGGEKISDSAVCHLGFTGCSVWIDPERDMTVVLLSNRVHPRRDNESIREFRPLLHDAIWAEVDGG